MELIDYRIKTLTQDLKIKILELIKEIRIIRESLGIYNWKMHIQVALNYWKRNLFKLIRISK